MSIVETKGNHKNAQNKRENRKQMEQIKNS